MDSTSENNKSSTAGVIKLEEGVSVTKQSNWFESAFSLTVAPGSNAEHFSAPRGSLDLAKEKANVHAALGHGPKDGNRNLPFLSWGET